MAAFTNPLERAVDSANASRCTVPLWTAVNAVRTLAFEAVATPGDDPRAVLHRMETLAAQITELCRDAFAADRRANQ